MSEAHYKNTFEPDVVCLKDGQNIYEHHPDLTEGGLATYVEALCGWKLHFGGNTPLLPVKTTAIAALREYGWKKDADYGWCCPDCFLQAKQERQGY